MKINVRCPDLPQSEQEGLLSLIARLFGSALCGFGSRVREVQFTLLDRPRPGRRLSKHCLVRLLILPTGNEYEASVRA